ncbi:peptidoglycan-binding LysM [Paenibacillus sp. GCM10027626]|uniref:peptidoglycan-binding LysM n=1 Tax=Paenibacillus sp. GCM10027626 TaxID=3273411 RepID=UPI0036274D57
MAMPKLERDYNIYMSWNNYQEAIYLPVMPERIELKRKGNGNTYEIVGLGQINTIQARDLAEISFESFFPGRERFPDNMSAGSYVPFLSSEVKKNPAALIQPPTHYVNHLNRWQDSRRPVRFVYKSPVLNISLAVSIEQFDRWEEAGAEGDVSFKLTLKEYAFHTARKIIIEKNPVTGKQKVKQAPKPRLDERVRPKTYTLKPGDDLVKVARLWYSDSSVAKEIQKLNNIPDAQLKNLPVGKVIKLPERK